MGSTYVSGIDQFRAASGTLVDVRTPSEFAQGHWPGAINIPLFDDEQRAIVGRTYKQKGRKQAIELGLSFTGPALVDLSKALTKAAGGPDQPLRLYCWRGGMRSNSMAWLASLQDHPTLVLEGGYKVYRRWVLEQFERPWPVRLLGGQTGTGKTDLLITAEAVSVVLVNPISPALSITKMNWLKLWMAMENDKPHKFGSKPRALLWAVAASPKHCLSRCSKHRCSKFAAVLMNGLINS